MTSGPRPWMVAAAVTLALVGEAHAKRRPTPAPQRLLQRVQEEVGQILRAGTTPGTPAALAEDERIRAAIGGLIDYRAISIASLGPRWDGTDAARREALAAAHREVIERKFIRQMRKHARHSVDYRSAAIDGDTSVVRTRVRDTDVADAKEATIDYRLHRGGGTWMVADIITNGTSTVADYHDQFEELLETLSIDALIDRLKRTADRR